MAWLLCFRSHQQDKYMHRLTFIIKIPSNADADKNKQEDEEGNGEEDDISVDDSTGDSPRDSQIFFSKQRH
ncbi:TPA: hypothetical protein N0F65_002039 [Lagenidium giganteum]|uniref:Uncharacterized protein n=1 Tax=Lagenidium giganteum TaxID=4803 RepID=A0AAV2Z0U3_9STRA|nr:TPA: hypothetical protein N0F65_002039 [Lagenidium giganteum]